MVTYFFFFAFVIASGFVAAAFITHGIAALSGRLGGIRFSFETGGEIALSFVICFAAGPYLTFGSSYTQWRNGTLSNALFGAAMFLSILWSFCLGFFVVQILALAGCIAL